MRNVLNAEKIKVGDKVIGTPKDSWGRRVHGNVVKKDGESVTIKNWVGEEYVVPERFCKKP